MCHANSLYASKKNNQTGVVIKCEDNYLGYICIWAIYVGVMCRVCFGCGDYGGLCVE